MPWLDAAWHPAAWVDGPIPFDASDRGLLLGDGVFDTSLVLGGRMVWRAAHLSRLTAHARALGFGRVAADETGVIGREVLQPRHALALRSELLVENDSVELREAAVDGALARLTGAHGALRLTLTRGPGPRGLAPPAEPHPTILATLAPLPGTLFAPLALHPTSIRRNETSPLSRAKSLGYGDAVLAAAEARAAGRDDALFLNEAGRVACAGTANVFAVFGRELVTPPLADGVLDGITRAVLLAAAPSLGLAATERSLRPSDLDGADAILCTSSLRLVATVTAIGAGTRPGDQHASALRDAVAEAVIADSGFDPRSPAAP